MLNCAIIMGRLTTDPELKTTPNGISVTSFTVAVDRNYQKPGQERQTDFINVSAWRQTGEFVSKYFTKGSMIAVSGRLQIRDYTDRDGNRRTAAEVVADNVYFGDSKRRDDGDQPARSSYSPSGRSGSQDSFRRADPAPGAFEDLSDDDGELPF